MADNLYKTLQKELDAGAYIDTNYINDLLRKNDTALTSQIAERDALRQYAANDPMFEARLAELNDPKNIQVPNLEGIFDVLGLKDIDVDEDTKVTAYQQFVNGFVPNYKDWKYKVTEKWGKNGWEIVKKTWQRAQRDEMMRDIGTKRANILEGYDEDGNFTPMSLVNWPSSLAMTLFTPRRKKAYMQGRDPSWKETTADMLSNALYAAPVGLLGNAGRAAAYGAASSAKAGKVLNALANSAVARGAGKAASVAAENAVAPFAVYGVDKAFGNETNIGDPLLGWATNYGVGHLFPTYGGKLYDWAMGNVRREGTGMAKDIVEGALTPRQQAKQLVNEAKAKLEAAAKETEEQFYDKSRKLRKPDRLTPEQTKEYEDIIHFAETELDDEGLAALRKVFEDPNVPAEKKADIYTRVWDEMVKEPVGPNDILSSDVVFDGSDMYKLRPVTHTETVLPEAPKTYDFDIVRKHPELANLKEPWSMYEALQTAAPDIAKNFVLNKYGSNKEATVAGKTFGVDTDKISTEINKAEKKDRVGVQVDDVLKNWELSDQDKKFLAKIKANPNIVKFGLNSPDGNENLEFNMWLISRGNDILASDVPDAYRPTWEVDEK